MKTSIKGMIDLADDEGIVLSPYLDGGGVWTVGIGHTAAAGSPDPARMARGVAISLDAVVDLFERDLVKYEKAVEKAFKRPLTQNQFDAAVRFHYNTGAIGKASWVSRFNAGRIDAAAQAMMLWVKDNGQTVPGLVSRRKLERDCFFHGKYSNTDGKVECMTATKTGRVIRPGKRIDISKAFVPRADPPVVSTPVEPKPDPVLAPEVEAPVKTAAPKSGWMASLVAFVASLFRKKG